MQNTTTTNPLARLARRVTARYAAEAAARDADLRLAVHFRAVYAPGAPPACPAVAALHALATRP